jgi:hypothetical protein
MYQHLARQAREAAEVQRRREAEEEAEDAREAGLEVPARQEESVGVVQEKGTGVAAFVPAVAELAVAKMRLRPSKVPRYVNTSQ